MTTTGIETALLALLLVAGIIFASAPGRAAAGEIALSAEDLYGGFECRNALLDEKAQKLTVDARMVKAGKVTTAVVITDVIDLGPGDGIIGSDGAVKSVDLELKAEVPEGETVTVETRSGAKFFDQSGWSEWSKLGGLAGKVAGLNGRYLQVKVSLTSRDPAKLPALTGLKLKAEVAPAAADGKPIEVVEEKIQKIVRSPVDFKYERPDHPKLVKFREEARLDEVVAGTMDVKLRDGNLRTIDASMTGAGEDFRQLVALMDWTGSCFNNRDKEMTKKTYKKTGYYDWNIESVWRLDEVEEGGEKKKRPTIYGHCMSYSQVLTIAATAMGYKARHLAVVGVRERSHEVCEAWVPSLGKWVYLDPSLTNYYFDKETRVPMCIIEMHKVITDTFIPEGKDVSWFMSRGKFAGEVQSYVKSKGGGQKHIGCRLGKFKYGAPMPEDYDWGWRHGYMVSGFVQITARNDFHANPKANPKRFEHYPGYGGYPLWVDAKTPPRRGSKPVSRMRDFYWTLDQASVKLTRKGAGQISVEFGNSMPFFKEYHFGVGADPKITTENGETITTFALDKQVTTESSFLWKLKPGLNQLFVKPVDEFGREGTASWVTLKL